MKFETINTFKGYGKQLHQSEVLNNGDFDYRIYIESYDLEEYTGDVGFTLNVKVAKTINFITDEKKLSVEPDFNGTTLVDVDIMEHGLCANIDSVEDVIPTEGEAIELINQFIKDADKYSSLIGFYLDRQQNAIGNNGWDFLDGNIGFK